MLLFCMKSAQLFRNGANQAVRIPRELEFRDVKSVRIEKEGENLILIPLHDFSWKSWQDQWSADDRFMAEGRHQPKSPAQSIF